MSQTDAIKVLDLIRASLATDSYRHLKDCLLRMYALTDYARFEAFSSLPLSREILPSVLMLMMLALLPADHQVCFFFRGAFLKCLPTDVRAHLVHDQTLDPLSLALGANEICQSRVCSASNMNHVSAGLPPLRNALFSPFVFHLPPVPIPSILLHLVPATAILRLLHHAIPTHLPLLVSLESR